MQEINLTKYIEHLFNELSVLLSSHGWERKDTMYFEYKPNSKANALGAKTMPDSWISFYPDILTYRVENKDITSIWLKSGERELSGDGVGSLFEAIEPFKDQDYHGRNIWINPLYPQGYWCNHTLGKNGKCTR